MKNNFLKSVVFGLALGLSIYVGNFSCSASNIKNMVNEVTVENVDKNTIVSDEEKILSGYVGYYEMDRDVLISQARKLIKDNGIINEFANMFSSYSLNINEDGNAQMVVALSINSTEITANTKMEFVSVAESDITFKVKNGDEFVYVVFRRKEMGNKRYLVCEKIGTEFCFEKVERV